ncbi:MltA domain-containing protein [Xenophilus arseniciresistens]|uniref:peptidoglycan lytic exotransglycosylase n=1 Tax=Xenophilus arseniciresistens TaxID=1283306 RepID=A0AAE3N9Y1_9BURK|nr:MltA domain-containing protein [Xenophilus arseniciresistens]MDA7418755.1 MltA domain-containing protein [Xenophilus arseniciresistens]
MINPPLSSASLPRAARAAVALAAMALAGCAWRPEPVPERPPAPAPQAAAPAPAPAPVAAPAPAPAAATGGGNVAGQARTFSTQLATYTAVSFDTLPGWARDDFSETWPAFLESCRVLTRRGEQWQNLCSRARAVNAKSDPAIRSFYESEFAAYQIRDDDRRPDGVVTGYFEPEIEGSRTYSPPFIYPVYGEPQDMVFLDTRRLPAGRGTVAARVEDRKVVIQQGLSTRDMGAPGLLALDLSTVIRDTLDRKMRLRVEGRQLLPYFTREEIETRGAPNARVLAFVSNANALYEMQIQGSGRIRLTNGDVIRLGYAEQNGQPFRPTLASNSGRGGKQAVRTRGSTIELEVDDGEDSDIGDVGAVRTRGFTLARPVASGAVVVPGRKAAGPVTGSGIKDPSYVFFKEMQAGAGPQSGPVGALGVPLQAGRSIAVDPRSTPLGYPVFVSTRMPGANAPTQRLTIAQDTGGAIRGAVRADYFFGYGQQAANQARRMKERGNMWILLPRGQQVAAAAVGTQGGIRTRGAALAGCLVPDEESCVDE